VVCGRMTQSSKQSGGEEKVIFKKVEYVLIKLFLLCRTIENDSDDTFEDYHRQGRQNHKNPKAESS
jgi:hypothetical protein